MGRPTGAKAQVIQDALRRFDHLPTRTISRYILADYGTLFNNDFEEIRGYIKYYRGANGEKHRRDRGIKGLPEVRKVPPTWSKKRTPYHLAPGLWLVINDLHIPFHTPKAVEAALEYGKDRGVTGIFINGDLQDYAAISFWAATARKDFDREVEMVIDFLDVLEYDFPGVSIVFKPGNHEYRLPRLYQSKVPELIGLPLAAMDTVLGLENRGIEFLDYFQLVYAGKLPILHGHEIMRSSVVVNPARGLFLRSKMWAMCGHHHRTSEHTESDLKGTLLTTWSVGCLCDLSPDWAPYGNSWNHGFALVNVEKNGMFQVENRRILPNGSVV